MRRVTRTLALTVALAMIALVVGASGQAASAATTSNQFGTMKVDKVTGEARNGATFAGQFNVKRFALVNGKIKAVGKLTGELTRKNGKTQDISERVRMPVKFDSATSAARTTSGAAGGCEILDLVLGPIDLDLLGLQVHLDRVHLNITAVPGAGNLLGNLLCAVAGLLDGPVLGGLNGILTNLLNAILGLLRA